MNASNENRRPGEDQTWLRLELLTGHPDGDAAKLAGLDALGVEVQDGDTFMDDTEFLPLPEGKSRLIAFFDADRPALALRRAVEGALDDVEIVSVADYADRSWETAWMDYFEAIELSPRVSVGPPWDEPAAPDDGLAIIIEPGMAFGTGSHETTQLCARMVDALVGDGDVETVLDVGCGSAILSMIAAGLGARRVVGIDIEDRAIEAAKANIDENGFSPAQIELSTRPIEQISETFDLVIANILAPILLDLRPHLLDAVAPGGDLLLSGIADDQLDDLRAAFDEPAFTEIDSDAQGEWTALHLRRRQRGSKR